ncbi:MAG: hypothetical protein GC171_04105 [Terrimonas sp.]|nr:hypothetical protein [Terrimonas sp.]
MKKNTDKLLLLSFLFILFVACNNDSSKETSEGQNASPAAKTKVDADSSGISIQTKGGTQISVGDNGGQVKTKDLDLNISTGH